MGAVTPRICANPRNVWDPLGSSNATFVRAWTHGLAISDRIANLSCACYVTELVCHCIIPPPPRSVETSKQPRSERDASPSKTGYNTAVPDPHNQRTYVWVSARCYDSCLPVCHLRYATKCDVGSFVPAGLRSSPRRMILPCSDTSATCLPYGCYRSACGIGLPPSFKASLFPKRRSIRDHRCQHIEEPSSHSSPTTHEMMKIPTRIGIQRYPFGHRVIRCRLQFCGIHDHDGRRCS